MTEKIQERKETILQVATDFFASSGYRNTDVQLIADKLEIGKGTIYRYFPSKENLFFATVDRAMKLMVEHVESKVKTVPSDIERIRMAIRSYIEFFLANPHFIELFVQERAEFRSRYVTTYLSHRAQINTEWRAMFQRLHAAGKMRMADFDRVIDYVTNGLYGIMFTNVFMEKQFKTGPKTEESIDMLLYGIFKEAP
jgi:AcrR family transcriptional regulator